MTEGKIKKADMQELALVRERLDRRNIAFDALFGLFEKLGATLNVSKIVRLFLLTLMGQLKLGKAALYLVLPDGSRLEAFHSIGTGKKDRLPAVEKHSAFIGWLKDAGGPVPIDDFFRDLGGSAAEEDGWVSDFIEGGFSYAFPMENQEELMGVLFYSGPVTRGGFSDFENELLRILATVASISIKNAWLYQTELQSKVELERFSEVKKEFINHTSHELRTPLTVLKSALWSIEVEEVQEGILVEMSKDAVLRLQRVVECLLSLNDLQLNKTDLNMVETEVSTILEESLQEVIPELEGKCIQVTMDDRARFRKVNVDASKIKIVLRSILDNAVNFVDRGGNINVGSYISDRGPGGEDGREIKGWCPKHEEPAGGCLLGERDAVRSGRGVIGGSGCGPYLVISVKDDGIGMPPDEMETIAEPFKRASNSSIRNVRGLGIGLSVSQKIVACHGGRLFCRSAESRGSEFTIWLPLYV